MLGGREQFYHELCITRDVKVALDQNTIAAVRDDCEFTITDIPLTVKAAAWQKWCDKHDKDLKQEKKKITEACSC